MFENPTKACRDWHQTHSFVDYALSVSIASSPSFAFSSIQAWNFAIRAFSFFSCSDFFFADVLAFCLLFFFVRRSTLFGV